MEETGAQIAKFRAETELEDNSVIQIFDMRVRFDQTKPVIIYHKGDPDLKDIITLTNNTPWCQSIRRDLIEENNIQYNPMIHIGEDIVYSLACMACADTIIALPQTIGYVYFVNHASVIQQLGTQTADSLMYLINQHNMVFINGLKYGLDIRYVFWDFTFGIANLIMATPQLSDEDRSKIRETYSDLFEMIEPIEPDEKFYPGTRAQEIMDFCRMAIFGDNTEEGIASKLNVLTQILKHNKNTDFGRSMGFSLINDYELYCKKVPLFDYAYFEPIFEISRRLGERNILCHDDVLGYAIAEGETGLPKTIPYTASHLKPFIDALIGEFKKTKGSTFLIMSSIPEAELDIINGKYRDNISGAVIRALDKGLLYSSHARKHKMDSITSPREVIFPEERFDTKNIAVVFALADPDVEQIVTPYTWILVEYYDYIIRNYKAIIDQIRTGKIFVSRYTQELLDTDAVPFAANPARAEELEKIFAAQGRIPKITEIWPKFRRIVAFGGGTFDIYTEKLRNYVDEDTEFDNGYFAATEAMVGRSMGPGSDEFILFTNQDFFEFLPCGTEPSQESLVPAESVVPGKDYEVFVTNTAGLYRYRLGEIIHIERMKDNVPVFTVKCGLHEYCTAGGVTLNVHDFNETIKDLETKSGLGVREYCAESNDDADTFRLLLELNASGRKESSDIATAETINKLAQYADEILCEKSAEYQSARLSGALKPVGISLLETETQLLYRDKNLAHWKCTVEQLKPVRILDTEEKKRFFHTFTIDNK